MPFLTLVAEVTTPAWLSGITSATFQPILDNIGTAMPVIIGFSVSLLAIRKTWKFIKGQMNRA